MEQGIKDYYALLRVAPDASHAAIKAAWKVRARELHPDLNAGDARKAEAFKQAAEAWRVLGSPMQRQLYDVSRASARGSGPAAPRGAAHARWQGQIRLLPWEAKILGALCLVLLTLYRKLARPASNPWFWLALVTLIAGTCWWTWPAGAWIMAGAVLATFMLQVVLFIYVYLRWAVGMLMKSP